MKITDNNLPYLFARILENISSSNMGKFFFTEERGRPSKGINTPEKPQNGNKKKYEVDIFVSFSYFFFGADSKT